MIVKDLTSITNIKLKPIRYLLFNYNSGLLNETFYVFQNIGKESTFKIKPVIYKNFRGESVSAGLTEFEAEIYVYDRILYNNNSLFDELIEMVGRRLLVFDLGLGSADLSYYNDLNVNLRRTANYYESIHLRGLVEYLSFECMNTENNFITKLSIRNNTLIEISEV